MSVSADGAKVQCHECGRWFTTLNSHLRTHGHTAQTYREAYDIPRTASLWPPATIKKIRRSYHAVRTRAGYAALQSRRLADAAKRQSRAIARQLAVDRRLAELRLNAAIAAILVHHPGTRRRHLASVLYHPATPPALRTEYQSALNALASLPAPQK